MCKLCSCGDTTILGDKRLENNRNIRLVHKDSDDGILIGIAVSRKKKVGMAGQANIQRYLTRQIKYTKQKFKSSFLFVVGALVNVSRNQEAFVNI